MTWSRCNINAGYIQCAQFQRVPQIPTSHSPSMDHQALPQAGTYGTYGTYGVDVRLYSHCFFAQVCYAGRPSLEVFDVHNKQYIRAYPKFAADVFEACPTFVHTISRRFLTNITSRACSKFAVFVAELVQSSLTQSLGCNHLGVLGLGAPFSRGVPGL